MRYSNRPVRVWRRTNIPFTFWRTLQSIAWMERISRTYSKLMSEVEFRFGAD
jgi:hypothetical protein